MLKTASFSRLTEFEKCPYRAKLKFIDKVPEPERPLKPGQTEQPNDRGTRVHQAAETYIQSNIELIPELHTFRPEYDRLRALYQEGKVSVEGEWGYTDAWQPTAWFSSDVWLRVKLDAMVRLSDTHAVVIDLKTGRKSGNEIKHGDQVLLYKLAAAFRYPELEQITAELWYSDADDITTTTASREQVMKHFKRFNDRFQRMTSATEFPAKPNKFNCMYCLYGPKGSGVCKVGV